MNPSDMRIRGPGTCLLVLALSLGPSIGTASAQLFGQADGWVDEEDIGVLLTAEGEHLQSGLRERLEAVLFPALTEEVDRINGGPELPLRGASIHEVIPFSEGGEPRHVVRFSGISEDRSNYDITFYDSYAGVAVIRDPGELALDPADPELVEFYQLERTEHRENTMDDAPRIDAQAWRDANLANIWHQDNERMQQELDSGVLGALGRLIERLRGQAD